MEAYDLYYLSKFGLELANLAKKKIVQSYVTSFKLFVASLANIQHNSLASLSGASLPEKFIPLPADPSTSKEARGEELANS